MYDDATGLCSEGVWHNSWLGTSYVLSARQIQAHDAQRAEELMDSAHQLAESLYTLARDTDGCLRRRTASGAWEDVEDEAVAAAVEAAGETAAFYAPSTERRSIANAAAVVFFSFLAEDSAEDDIARVRLAELGAAFTRTFFDTGCCRFRRSDGGDDYWRAADQALGCLACLRLAKLGISTAASRAMATSAADSLLQDYGYSLYATERQPPGVYLNRRPVVGRNSWIDGLASFALLASGCLGVGGETPAGLVAAMVESYRRTPDGVISHLPRERAAEDDGDTPVAFTSTQAIWSAVVRAANLEDSGERAREAGGADVVTLRAYYDANVKRTPPEGLLPVANVYPDARVWANTEWASFIIIDRADFGLGRA